MAVAPRRAGPALSPGSGRAPAWRWSTSLRAPSPTSRGWTPGCSSSSAPSASTWSPPASWCRRSSAGGTPRRWRATAAPSRASRPPRTPRSRGSAELHRQGKEPLETEIQRLIMERFDAAGLETDQPPIVAVNAHAGDPHYEPSDATPTRIRKDDLVLIDLWAREKGPRDVYADITWVGFAGDAPPPKLVEIFEVTAGARDAGLAMLQQGFREGRTLQGWEVNRVVRDHIGAAGYGDAFVHRTGHSIDTRVHGDGANLDDLETHDTRRLVPGLGFSIEPGIYLPAEGLGVRSEIDVFLSAEGPRVFGPSSGSWSASSDVLRLPRAAAAAAAHRAGGRDRGDPPPRRPGRPRGGPRAARPRPALRGRVARLPRRAPRPRGRRDRGRGRAGGRRAAVGLRGARGLRGDRRAPGARRRAALPRGPRRVPPRAPSREPRLRRAPRAPRPRARRGAAHAGGALDHPRAPAAPLRRPALPRGAPARRGARESGPASWPTARSGRRGSGWRSGTAAQSSCTRPT